MPGSSAAGTCLRQISNHRPRNVNDSSPLVDRSTSIMRGSTKALAKRRSAQRTTNMRLELLRLEVDVAAGDHAHRLAEQALLLDRQLRERRADVGHGAREPVIGLRRAA